MNLLNLTMELSLVFLGLMTLIGELADFSYDNNEILGLVTIILMLIAQVICFILIILETIYMLYHCFKTCFGK